MQQSLKVFTWQFPFLLRKNPNSCNMPSSKPKTLVFDILKPRSRCVPRMADSSSRCVAPDRRLVPPVQRRRRKGALPMSMDLRVRIISMTCRQFRKHWNQSTTPKVQFRDLMSIGKNFLLLENGLIRAGYCMGGGGDIAELEEWIYRNYQTLLMMEPAGMRHRRSRSRKKVRYLELTGNGQLVSVSLPVADVHNNLVTLLLDLLNKLQNPEYLLDQRWIEFFVFHPREILANGGSEVVEISSTSYEPLLLKAVESVTHLSIEIDYVMSMGHNMLKFHFRSSATLTEPTFYMPRQPDPILSDNLIVAIWNVRGANTPSLCPLGSEVRTILGAKVLILTETRMSRPEAEAIIQGLGYALWDIKSGELDGGGVWICWDARAVDVSILEEEGKLLHANIADSNVAALRI